MPEVCEVALTAQILNKYMKGNSLEDFIFTAGRWNRKSPPGYDKFCGCLPMEVKRVNSKGKFIWFELEASNGDGWYIWNTLGLTGLWSMYEPKYEKAVLNFDNGLVVYFSDMRNFGTFKFDRSSENLEKKLSGLGPDFLKEDFDLSKINNYDKPVVELLMDQKKIGSGIGNYLSAEVLYRAKISPYRLGSSLTDKEIDKLTYWIKYLTKLCYNNNHIGYMVGLEKESNKIKKIDYHPEIKLKSGEFEFQVYRQKKDPHGNKVETANIIKGRTTYWVPAVQR